MVRVLHIKLIIRSGRSGHTSPVRIRINGHTLPVTLLSGGTGPGEHFEGEADIRSVVHSMELLGPTAGSWEIASAEICYRLESGDGYSYEVPGCRLESHDAVNIWSATPTFSV